MKIGRWVAREIAREIGREWNWRATYGRLQAEAAARPDSKNVQTPAGYVWMSPIEFKLYEALCNQGLSPVPQFCIEGYYVDFAFPDVWLAVEADGAPYHGGQRRQRDRKRDWILRRAGWTVKRFRGSTIHAKAANCAYVVRQEVESRRAMIAHRARQREMRRQARRAAILRPFMLIRRLLARRTRRDGDA